jgi:hypothetical protein
MDRRQEDVYLVNCHKKTFNRVFSGPISKGQYSQKCMKETQIILYATLFIANLHMKLHFINCYCNSMFLSRGLLQQAFSGDLSM